MYKEDKKNIGWLVLILRSIIVFLIFILVVKLVSMGIAKYRDNSSDDYMKENLKIMDKAAKKYFVDDNLPDKLGKTNKVTLNTLVEQELIEELKDKDGNTCSLDASFIQATRLDSEYQIKSYLECGEDSEYLNSFVKIEDGSQTIKVESTTTTTKPTTTTTKKQVTTNKKTTTKKVTTTKKATTTSNVVTTRPTVSTYYSVTFNTNGGYSLPTQSVRPGSKIAKVIPKRDGYKFVGWYYNGQEFDLNTAINKDYVLVAKWIKE